MANAECLLERCLLHLFEVKIPHELKCLGFDVIIILPLLKTTFWPPSAFTNILLKVLLLLVVL